MTFSSTMRNPEQDFAGTISSSIAAKAKSASRSAKVNAGPTFKIAK